MFHIASIVILSLHLKSVLGVPVPTITELAEQIEIANDELKALVGDLEALQGGHDGLAEGLNSLNGNLAELLSGQKQVDLLLVYLCKLQNVTIPLEETGTDVADEGNRTGKSFGGFGGLGGGLLALLQSILGTGIGGIGSSFGVAPAFNSKRLVPDIITTAPTNLLTVQYSNPSVFQVFIGTELHNQIGQTNAPVLTFAQANAAAGSLYTIIMVDPDVPSGSRPTQRSFVHWFVTNVPGSTLRSGFNSQIGGAPAADEQLAYRPPNPRRSSGIHRYTFLAFLQGGGARITQAEVDAAIAPAVLATRINFNVRTFISTINAGAGPGTIATTPAAGNFFLAKRDS